MNKKSTEKEAVIRFNNEEYKRLEDFLLKDVPEQNKSRIEEIKKWVNDFRDKGDSHNVKIVK